jgi:hypothetical protein
MASNGILTGYPDNTFRPNQTVNRAEFATILIKALKIPKYTPDTPSFKDVEKNYWAYESIESSKKYLTWYKTADTNLFKPQEISVREDIAVSLVKGLNLKVTEENNSILLPFQDKDQISGNLRKYLAVAVQKGILKGEINKEGNRTINPQAALTRAELSALIYNTLKIEKVTDDEEKVTDENPIIVESTKPSQPEPSPSPLPCPTPTKKILSGQGDLVAPHVSCKVDGSKIIVYWDRIDNPKLSGYKVVISKDNSNPKYPENGYLYWITDRNKTNAEVDNNEPYKNGDFGTSLTPGETYYFSVTAVYTDTKIPGNSISMTFPE